MHSRIIRPTSFEFIASTENHGAPPIHIPTEVLDKLWINILPERLYIVAAFIKIPRINCDSTQLPKLSLHSWFFRLIRSWVTSEMRVAMFMKFDIAGIESKLSKALIAANSISSKYINWSSGIKYFRSLHSSSFLNVKIKNHCRNFLLSTSWRSQFFRTQPSLTANSSPVYPCYPAKPIGWQLILSSSARSTDTRVDANRKIVSSASNHIKWPVNNIGFEVTPTCINHQTGWICSSSSGATSRMAIISNPYMYLITSLEPISIRGFQRICTAYMLGSPWVSAAG